MIVFRTFLAAWTQARPGCELGGRIKRLGLSTVARVIVRQPRCSESGNEAEDQLR
jgi:hypothetical protein